MEQEPLFPDFRVISVREWLNVHKYHPKDMIVGESETGAWFRFLKCERCGEVYFMGKIEEDIDD